MAEQGHSSLDGNSAAMKQPERWAQKRPLEQSVEPSSQARSMMRNMGYADGSGLGVREQGIRVTVPARAYADPASLGACSSAADVKHTEHGITAEKKSVQRRMAEQGHSSLDGNSAAMKQPERWAQKRPLEQSVEPSSKAWSMMRNMGYADGSGLGVREQGIRVPVPARAYTDRAGLGAYSSAADVKHTEHRITVEEKPIFFPHCTYGQPSREELENGISVGKMPLVMDEQTQFCSKDLLMSVLSAKDVFDTIGDRDLRDARSRANPFELIRGAIFQNRAAMKMANLDAIFDFQLSNPRNSDGEPVVPASVDHDELFYFADICAGPGGFTEYLLWKREWSARGFGMTLTGKDDFRLDKFLVASPKLFEPFYGSEGDGDVTKRTNLDSFQQFIMNATDQLGVHLVMADGGFSVEGRENIQEVLSKRLYLCQALCALTILREGGNFVCKLFDTFTVFTVGLLNLLWRCFDKMTIHKPHTSRPANSETFIIRFEIFLCFRYLVCLGFKGPCEVIKEHLFLVNDRFSHCNQNSSQPYERWMDVISIIPDEMLRGDPKFCEHMRSRNEQLAARQTRYLKLYKEYAGKKYKKDERQETFRSECLEYWGIPDVPRPNLRSDQRKTAAVVMQQFFLDVTNLKEPRPISMDRLNEIDSEHVKFQLLCMPDQSNESDVRIICSLGRYGTYFWRSTMKSWWRFSEEYPLLENTVIVANITSRRKTNPPGQRGCPVIRILDAMVLGNEDVTQFPIEKRLKIAGKYCRALTKVHGTNCGLEVADLWSVQETVNFLRNTEDAMVRVHNNWRVMLKEGLPRDQFYCLEKLLLLPVDQVAGEGRSGDQKLEGDDKLKNIPFAASSIIALPKGMDVTSEKLLRVCINIAGALERGALIRK